MELFIGKILEASEYIREVNAVLVSVRCCMLAWILPNSAWNSRIALVFSRKFSRTSSNEDMKGLKTLSAARVAVRICANTEQSGKKLVDSILLVPGVHILYSCISRKHVY